ncbi:MAG TPA: ornithine carbamoyltransferase, partial [Spirochaetia bacterium]|nr:ornithine carbamoyltransferase [Spirochaetia bacterium]
LCLADCSPVEIMEIIAVATELKERRRQGDSPPLLAGQTLGLIFQKASTRTRISFEVAMFQLGGHSLFMPGGETQLGRGESISDTGRVLSRYLDGIVIRTYAHADVEELARWTHVPVINGLTDLQHPCQVLADLLTIYEHKGRLAGLKLAYVGDGNNMAHSLLIGGAKVGMRVAVATPSAYRPDPAVVAKALAAAREGGGEVEILEDPAAAVAEADVVVTDVWASMGCEEEQDQRAGVFPPYQVNAELTAGAKPDFLFLHCLPAHRGEEVTADIIDGPHSVVWDEAENRLHAQKALLALLLKGGVWS